MADIKIPYVNAHGRITTTLNAISKAPAPERFTIDFLSTKLGVKGGSARPVIPFLKRTGFLGSDGVPTDLYHRFRTDGEKAAAAADALKHGFALLYESNEYAHDLKDKDLTDLVVRLTGLEKTNPTTRAITGSFKALRDFADFDAVAQDTVEQVSEQPAAKTTREPAGRQVLAGAGGINLGYTINLHLPATSDIAVFNAIFKSLNEHLMR